MFFFFCLAFVSNLLGYFWLYVASLARNEFNSSEPGMDNYCAPDVWYTAQFAVNGFWVCALIIIVKTGASAHKLFRGNEALIDVIELGKNPDTGEEDSMAMPKKRVGTERMGQKLPK